MRRMDMYDPLAFAAPIRAVDPSRFAPRRIVDPTQFAPGLRAGSGDGSPRFSDGGSGGPEFDAPESVNLDALAELLRTLGDIPAIQDHIASGALDNIPGYEGIESWDDLLTVTGFGGASERGFDALGGASYGGRAGKRNREPGGLGVGRFGLVSDYGGHRSGGDRDDDATRRDRSMRRGEGPSRDAGSPTEQPVDTSHRTAGFVAGVEQQPAEVSGTDAPDGGPDAPDSRFDAPGPGPDAPDAGAAARSREGVGSGGTREEWMRSLPPGVFYDRDGDGEVDTWLRNPPGINPNPDANPSVADLAALHRLLGYFHPAMFWGQKRATNPRRVRPDRETGPNPWVPRLVVPGLGDEPPKLSARASGARPMTPGEFERRRWGGVVVGPGPSIRPGGSTFSPRR